MPTTLQAPTPAEPGKYAIQGRRYPDRWRITIHAAVAGREYQGEEYRRQNDPEDEQSTEND